MNAFATAALAHEVQRIELVRHSGAKARVGNPFPLFGAFDEDPGNHVAVNIGVNHHEVVDHDVRGVELQTPPLALQPQLDGAILLNSP